jgi:heptosyltransferase III
MRILFITSTYLGDAILSTGILDHLQKTYPEAAFYIACGPVPAPLFDALPNRKATYIIRKKPLSLHWLNLWAHCVFKPWHLVIDMRGTLLSYALLTRHRKIWHTPSGKNLRVHQIARWFGLAKTPFSTIWTTKKNKEEALNFLPSSHTYIAFSPTANWDKKCWPVDSFIQLGKKLLKNKKMFPNAKILVLGTADQRETIAPLFNAFDPEDIIDLMGKPSLPTLFCCLTQCSVFIGNDSGLMHLAATSNIPTVGLFGPSPVTIYGPWGKKTGTVALKDSQEHIFNRIKKGEDVMKDIAVDRVYDETLRLLTSSESKIS